MSCLIQLKQISKQYPDQQHPALQNISFTVHHGECLAITGASGSGKSTLMNILGLLDRPSHGQYLLMNKDTHDCNSNERALMRNQVIGFIFQSFYLLPRLTVLDNLILPMLYRKEKNKIAKQKATALLKQLNMDHWILKKPNQLSGGQQQRVAIARALVNQPQLILADEPTGALDQQTGQFIMDELFALNRSQQTTLIVITHDASVYSRFSRIIHLTDGVMDS